MDDVLVAVSSPPSVDLDLFSSWTEGLSAEETFAAKVEHIRELREFQGLEFRRSNQTLFLSQADLMQCEIFDHYRSFEILRHYLQQPKLLKSQSLVSIAADQQPSLIEKYWSIDESFVREILNKRLSRSRKDLEDISESTGLQLRSVMRQFENIKRIFSAYDETPSLVSTNMYTFVTRNFLLSPKLSRKYACILFLLVSRFNLTAKKRMLKIACERLEYCAALVLTYLALDSSSFFTFVPAELSDIGDASLLDNHGACWALVWRIFTVVESLDPDKQLMASLRDIRSAVTGDALEIGFNAARQRLPATVVAKLDASHHAVSKLRGVVRSLIQIGANLSQSREYRDLLEDILGKIAEPLEEMGLNVAEISLVVGSCYFVVADIPENMTKNYRSYSAYSEYSAASTSTHAGSGSVGAMSSVSLGGAKDLDVVKRDWLRFIIFVKLCVIQLTSIDS